MNQAPAAEPRVIEIYFPVLPGTMLLDFAGTAESFRVAAEFGAPFRLHYVAPASQAPSSLGLTLGGLEPLPEALPEGAIVLIPGVAKSAKDYLLPEAVETARWLGQSRPAASSQDRNSRQAAQARTAMARPAAQGSQSRARSPAVRTGASPWGSGPAGPSSRVGGASAGPGRAARVPGAVRIRPPLCRW